MTTAPAIADESLERLTLAADATVGAAAHFLATAAVPAMLVESDGRLAGIVSERDLLRAVATGAQLDDAVRPFAHTPPVTVDSDTDRAQVIENLEARGELLAPIVDERNHVLGVHLRDRPRGPQRLSNHVVVQAGGKGTRLRPLTYRIPKPMVSIAGRPLLERILLQLVGEGVRRVWLVIGYLGHIIEDHFGDGADYGCRIEYIREDPDQPLGTGGALSLLARRPDRPNEPFVMMNGDLLGRIPVRELLAAHASGGGAITVSTARHSYQVPFGVVEQTDDGGLDRMREKPTIAWPVNAGVYVLDPVVLSRVPPGTEYPITRLIEDSRERGEHVPTVTLPEDWQDIGTPDELARARGLL